MSPDRWMARRRADRFLPIRVTMPSVSCDSVRLYPLTIKDAKAAGSGIWEWVRPKRVSAEVLASHLTQLADLLRTGSPCWNRWKFWPKNRLTRGWPRRYRSEELGCRGGLIRRCLGKISSTISDICVSIVRAGAEGGFMRTRCDAWLSI